MKKTNVIIVLTVLAVLVVSAGAFGQDSDGDGKPIAFFPEASYEFAPVPEGTVIHHDYPVKNKGTADLEIQDVKAG